MQTAHSNLQPASANPQPRLKLHRIERLLQALLRDMAQSSSAGNSDRPESSGTKIISKAAGQASNATTIADFFADKLLVHRVTRQGIPYNLYQAIKDRSPIGENEWATLLATSSKTLQRHARDNRPFKGLHAQRIVQVFEAVFMGLETFDDSLRLGFWLSQPNHALGGVKPIELLSDAYGTELVLGELHRVQRGLFA